jgi:hypothetical protein
VQRLIVVLKAFAVMAVAGFGGAAIGAGIKVSRDGGEVGFGTFLLAGAFFLYRAWFTRGMQNPKD